MLVRNAYYFISLVWVSSSLPLIFPLHPGRSFAIIPAMKKAIFLISLIILALLLGDISLSFAQDDSSGLAAEMLKGGKKPNPTAPASPPSVPAKDSVPPQSTDALSSFSEQIKTFLSNPDIIDLITKNSIVSWVMLLFWIFVGMVTGKICSLILRRAGYREWTLPTVFLSDLAGPANLFLITIGLTFGLMGIQMNDYPKSVINKLLLLLYYISVFWYAYNLISIVDNIFSRIGKKSDSSLATHVSPLVRRTLRVFLVVIAAMFIVQSVFKQDIGAWLAGLGIAGLAVSLAAQDSLKNLFGSITIIMDQSFKIGERIICAGCDGVIEDIGLRTTRVRTTAGHLVSIPNANIVNSPIENVSRRTSIRRNFTLALKLDTPPEKMKQAIAIINDILAEPGICEPIYPIVNGKQSPPQVFFSDYTPSSMNLTITYWYAPPNGSLQQAHAEKINLRILDEFNQADIKLSST